MTPEQINEAMRLASIYATQRAVRATAFARNAHHSATTRAQLDLRVARAGDKLRNYLTQFQTVSDAHTTEGESK